MQRSLLLVVDLEEKYLLQVQKDYGNFSPELQVLGDLINSILGIK